VLDIVILLFMDNKSTQINIRIDKNLHGELKAQAEEEVTTTSQLVRKAITLYLRKCRA